MERSTGPRTPEGNASTSRNADRADTRGRLRAIGRLLRATCRIRRTRSLRAVQLLYLDLSTARRRTKLDQAVPSLLPLRFA
jgi:hypothetical protein